VIEAVGHGNAVTFTANQPVEDLLRPADRVVVKTRDDELSIPLRRDKVKMLLAQTRKCRAMLRRRGAWREPLFKKRGASALASSASALSPERHFASSSLRLSL
jgi:hypothetical protein